MECTFMVGDKVTLKDDGGWDAPDFLTVPQFGEVYTIRAIDAASNKIYLLFKEIENPICWSRTEKMMGEPGFNHTAFRRVINTDISDLQAIVRKEFETNRELLPMGAIR